MIIGVAGYAASGKDSIADYLEKKYGFKHLDFFRDILLSMLRERGLKEDKMNASVLGNELRQNYGRGALAKLMAERLIENTDYVITGFRSPEEVEEIRKKGEFLLLWVWAPLKKRFSRRRDIDPQNIEEFKRRDELDKEKGMDEVFKSADIIINNEGSIEELHQLIDSIMEKLR